MDCGLPGRCSEIIESLKERNEVHDQETEEAKGRKNAKQIHYLLFFLLACGFLFAMLDNQSLFLVISSFPGFFVLGCSSDFRPYAPNEPVRISIFA